MCYSFKNKIQILIFIIIHSIILFEQHIYLSKWFYLVSRLLWSLIDWQNNVQTLNYIIFHPTKVICGKRVLPAYYFCSFFLIDDFINFQDVQIDRIKHSICTLLEHPFRKSIENDYIEIGQCSKSQKMQKTILPYAIQVSITNRKCLECSPSMQCVGWF